MDGSSKYPAVHDHRAAWSELARGISALRNQVREIAEGEIAPNSRPGELVVIGSGIETVGFALGDQKLIESADKVLFCVADPATIVWLKQLRPDALDLYVLYGENKPRYTTYMQMAEAQLYWVRQGLKVVVVFYGHPGIFVLSTHRAIKLARREGHKASMKASVSALDTLCADLGVDPAHPGLQTHEATDALLRQRTLDASLHVVLWQVGLIGELGYRPQGYLNNNFSYFVNWLQRVYGDDYEVIHYVGSRYPTVPALVEKYRLQDLHNPETQLKITGISTFYLAPRDVKSTDPRVAQDLGLLRAGQTLVTPAKPLREIGAYGPKEMKAFDAFDSFSIPPSYKWQEETGASKFLIELRFDPALQQRYETDPVAAVSDARFAYLTDKERAMLASRDAGSIQIACKGAYQRSVETERFIAGLLTQKESAKSLFAALKGRQNGSVSHEFDRWLEQRGFEIERNSISQSIDYIQRNALYPWTGVYLEPQRELLLTIVGSRERRANSILYVNGERIDRFKCADGVIQWQAGRGTRYNGFLRADADGRGNRRMGGKIWASGEEIPRRSNFTADEVDPERKSLLPIATRLLTSNALADVSGQYLVRTAGGGVSRFRIATSELTINNQPIPVCELLNGTLRWTGGNGNCYAGTIRFLVDPIVNTVELVGTAEGQGGGRAQHCYGSCAAAEDAPYCGPRMPAWAASHMAGIVRRHSAHGGLLLWHKWEKQNYTSMVVNKLVSKLQ
jgi:hypothetical protein